MIDRKSSKRGFQKPCLELFRFPLRLKLPIHPERAECFGIMLDGVNLREAIILFHPLSLLASRHIQLLFSSSFLRQFLYLLDNVIIGVLHLGEDSETDGSSNQQPSQG